MIDHSDAFLEQTTVCLPCKHPLPCCIPHPLLYSVNSPVRHKLSPNSYWCLQETAINIGFACSLLRNDMTQYIISANLPEVLVLEDAGKTEEAYKLAHSKIGEQLVDALQCMAEAKAADGGDNALIIDGKALLHGLATDLKGQLLQVDAMHGLALKHSCDCCRCQVHHPLMLPGCCHHCQLLAPIYSRMPRLKRSSSGVALSSTWWHWTCNSMYCCWHLTTQAHTAACSPQLIPKKLCSSRHLNPAAT